MRGWKTTALCVTILASSAVADDAVKTVQTPPRDRRNSFYASNREPLAASPLAKLPIGAVVPEGWVRRQLELMRDGMTGHLDELSHWVQMKDSAWLSKDGTGVNGWEELPYWLRGVGDLGYVLHDERLTALAKQWCDGVMAAQRPDGYFGSEENRGGGPGDMQLGVAGKLKGPDLWPQMPMLDALESCYEASVAAGKPDDRILSFLEKYFRWEAALPKEQLLAGSWQKIRGGDNEESVLWLYNHLGGRESDRWLLDLARTLHENTSPWETKVASWHGVNICQGFREPAVWSQVSKDPADFDAAVRNYREVMTRYGQVPGGMFAADENCRPGFADPRQAAETCSMVEFMNSFEQLAAMTGDPAWADRVEEVAFNSLPAAFTADYKALHYLTSPNCVQLDKNSKAPDLNNGGEMISYSPGEEYRCCQHNHAMGWPYYAERMWMATSDNGLAAVLYGQSEVAAKVASGDEVRITETTDYPFEGRVSVAVHTPKPVRFPLYLRVPAWARVARVTVFSKDGQHALTGDFHRGDDARGGYLRVDREWADGDWADLDLALEIQIVRWAENKNAASVRRGPLWFSLRIGEQYVKSGGTEAFPECEVFPTSDWNYGLVLAGTHPEKDMKVKTSIPVKPQPWTTEDAPVRIWATGRKIPNWKQDRLGMVGVLQQSPVKGGEGEPEQPIELIPMGAARLRISAFPVIGDGPDAHDWVAPPPARHAASYEYDDIDAISDGKVPASSNDHSIPRFTWWDHRGTTEWVTWKFDKPRQVSSCAVYWFDDTGEGQCRVPASWRLLYRDGDQWRVVPGISGYSVLPDQFNDVKFAPVQTSELKLEVTLQPRYSAGILEWKAE